MINRILVLLFILSSSAFGRQASENFTSSNLPIIIIDTNGQEIPYSNPRITANMHVIYNGEGIRNYLNDPPNHYSGNISIEIRGESSSTWDIKSYSIETQNADSTNRNVSLLGLPEDNDWILHAPFYDRSLMRNVLSYHLAREMGWYASRTVYSEVILNGEYLGIYVLMEKIKRDKNRVDIANLSPDETSGDDVTGGYILRVDKEPWNPGFDSGFPPNENTAYRIRYQYYHPKGDEIVSEQETYIRNFIHDFEELMHNGDYSDPDSGYTQYLNIDSFLDYVILNELSRNVDGYRLSSYLTKQKDSNGGKLIAGPAWDYNFSYGNAGYYEAERIEGWQLLFFADTKYFHDADNFQLPFWWKVLFTDGGFTKKLVQRWTELRQDILSVNSLNNVMDHFASITSEARPRNFDVRPKPGTTNLGGGWHPYDPRNQQINSYEDELRLTKEWIANRIEWMDSNIPLLVSNEPETSSKIPGSFTLLQNYPNPFNPSTNISFEVPHASFVSITIYNTQGQLVQQLLGERMTAGTHQVTFNAEIFPSGLYFYTLKAENFHETKKMLLVK